MSEQPSFSLEALIQEASGLDAHESTRLADAWAADVMGELRTTGISVIRGLGTFTLTDAGIRFEQNDDFPSLTDFPAVEGFSPALASMQNRAEASSGATSLPADPPQPTSPTLGMSATVSAGTPPESTSEDGAPPPIPSEVEQAFAGPDSGTEQHKAPPEEADSAETIQPDETDTSRAKALPPEADEPAKEDLSSTDAERSTEERLSAEGVAHSESEVADEPVSDVSSEQTEPLSDIEGEDAAWALGLDRGAPATEDEAAASENDVSEPDTDAASVSADDISHSDEEDDALSGDSEQPAPTETESQAKAAAPRSRSPRRYERDQSGSGRAALWALGVVVLLVAAALIYRFALTPAAEDPVLAAETQEPSEQLQDSSATAAGALEGVEDGLATDDSTTVDPAGMPVAPSDTPATPDEDAVTALDSDSTDESQPDQIVRGMGGYTLVVGSTLTESTARTALSEFATMGWPMGVLAYESEDLTRYRIAVGHYDSAAEADSARIQFATELPEGTWVLSVR